MKPGTAEEAQMLLKMQEKATSLLAVLPLGQIYREARGKKALEMKFSHKTA